jgi:uncharacterized coiled-coil protein SlyX
MPIEKLIEMVDHCERLRGLEEFGACQEVELARFAAQKRRENLKLQADLDRITEKYRAKMASNTEEVIRYQEALQDWQRWKDRESHSADPSLELQAS